MTPRQFETEFERARKSLPDTRFREIELTTEDRQYYLNEAIHVFVTKKLKVEVDKYGGIKRSQRELDEIRELILKNTTLSKDSISSNTEYDVFDLPANYLYLISDKSITSHCGAVKRYQNRMYSSERIQEIIEDTHYGSKYNSPVSELVGNKLYVYKTSNFTISSVSIDYIKNFDSIDILGNTNTNLNPSTHKDIVQLAVTIFSAPDGDNRFRSNVDKNVITKQLNVN